MSKHAPKPWQFVTEGRERKIIADGQAIMCDTHYYPWCPYNDADWRLIAAAPDLLENLQQLCELLESIDHDCTPARAAIAKATGQNQ